MEYEGTVYRPPSEARSLIIQVTVGCAHNRCTFCNMYRVKKFRVRTKEEIMKDLDECRDYYGPYVSRVFFADGDALVVKTELLLELLAYVHKNFPYVERITSYGTAKDVLAKSEEDLKALAAAGLEMVYIGAESGDDRVLEHIHKDVTAAQIAAAVSGLGNTRRLLQQIERGEVHYDFVEVMACPGGCVGGGGQPIHDGEERAFARGKKLYELDAESELRYSHENPDIKEIYSDFFGKPMSHKAHMLLHTEHWKNQ